MHPVLFKIGPLTIYSLGVLWALAAFVAAWIVRLELKRYGHDPEIAVSVVTAAAIGGLLGARLLFILEEWETFTQAPFDFIFSGAGFSWYGGLFGGALAAALGFQETQVAFSSSRRHFSTGSCTWLRHRTNRLLSCR